MLQPNILQKFILEHRPVRGSILRLSESYQSIVHREERPAAIQMLIGEAVLTSVLLMSSIKTKGNLTLQFRGSGAVTLLVARCTHDFHLRGLAQYDEELLAHAILKPSLLEKGELVVTITNDNPSTPYQSIIELKPEGIASSIEYYFAQSEQIATRLLLRAGLEQGYGIILQLMPTASELEQQQFWSWASNLDQVVAQPGFWSLPNEEMLPLFFPGEEIRIFEEEKLKARCDCTVDRMKRAVVLFGEKEARDILLTHQYVEVTCEFCGKSYSFDSNEINEIFSHNKDS